MTIILPSTSCCTWGGFSFIINLIKQNIMTIEEYKQLMKRDILKIGLDVDENETEETTKEEN